MTTLTRYLFLALFAAAPLFAQTEEEPNPFETSDTTIVIEEDTSVVSSFSDEGFFQGLLVTRSYIYEDVPFIEFSMGNSLPSYDKTYMPRFGDSPLRDDYGMHNIAEIKLGFKDMFSLQPDGYVTGTNGQSFYISTVNFNILKGMNDVIIPPEQQLEAWRFGFSNFDGYGYRIADAIDVHLNHAQGINWTRASFRGETPDSVNYLAKERLGNRFRFGENYESSISITPYKYVTLGATFEQAVVYPRHMFWYWTASKLVEASAFGLLDWFVDEVEERAPAVVPVVNFALKTGLSYGYYKLLKREMNWPINTEPPFMYDNFKVTLAINFN